MNGSRLITDNWYRAPEFYGCYLIFMFCVGCIVVTAILHTNECGYLERIFIVLIVLSILVACLMEYSLQRESLLDGVLVVGTCVLYYFMVMQVYERDALTGLLNRHNFQYDLGELGQCNYCLVMTDIDNFKIINDKYGHQKGDEALVLVARTIEKYLPKRSRLYRYGGDEFIIISRKCSASELEEVFRKANRELEESSYRVSYGIVEHIAGEKAEDTLARADAVMYDNKHLLKREDIWDEMTGLYNIHGYLDELEQAKKQALRDGLDICLVGMDIERLKNINMGYGYVEGNMIIMTLGDIIKSSLEMGEFAGHLGSDEFMVALKIQPGDTQYARDYINKIMIGVRNTSNFADKEYTVEVNAVAEALNLTPDTSMNDCVNRMLANKQSVKQNQRKSVFSYDEFDDFDAEEEKLALEIIDNRLVKYVFQPIISAKDGSIVAYEALMRSNTEPQLSPLTILRYAAKNGKSYEVEKLTFYGVLERLETDDSIPEDAKIFLNSIPGHTLKDEDYQELRKKYTKWFSKLVVEITEQSELDDESLAMMKERQDKDGFELAIDDFGSGNSNTYSLLRYRPDCIKLDRLLISDIDRNTKKQYFVNSIITFAKENGMSVLAEGVETEEELKMVIRLQVDYIQGYFTAKPSESIITKIAEEKRHIIVSENMRGVIEGKRKIFVASSNYEVSLVQLALQEYTGITVSMEKMFLMGNSDYAADMCIKVKDGLSSTLILRDVHLNSVDDFPCIDLGDNSHLTLVLEGDCALNYKGIHVPESSSITFKGSGNLVISAKGHFCYGIGSGRDEAVGSIFFQHSGLLTIRVDGDECIAVGGGKYVSGQGILSESGKLEIVVGGPKGLGIGCIYGDIPIRLCGLYADIDLRLADGSAIGSMNGNQNIDIRNFILKIHANGTRLAGIGTNHKSGGFIHLNEGEMEMGMFGQNLNLIGVGSGPIEISAVNVKAHIRGEGNEVLAIGTLSRQAEVHFQETTIELVVYSAKSVMFGAKEGGVYIEGSRPLLNLNGAESYY